MNTVPFSKRLVSYSATFWLPWLSVIRLQSHNNSEECTLRSLEKHFQGRTAEPQISPLRSPGFPVENRGVDQQHAVFLRKTAHAVAASAAELENRATLVRGHPYGVVGTGRLEGEVCGIPHLAKNERDASNFLYAALDRIACAPLFKERRMKFREPTKLHRKSGMWGTRRWLTG